MQMRKLDAQRPATFLRTCGWKIVALENLGQFDYQMDSCWWQHAGVCKTEILLHICMVRLLQWMATDRRLRWTEPSSFIVLEATHLKSSFFWTTGKSLSGLFQVLNVLSGSRSPGISFVSNFTPSHTSLGFASFCLLEPSFLDSYHLQPLPLCHQKIWGDIFFQMLWFVSLNIMGFQACNITSNPTTPCPYPSLLTWDTCI